MESTFFENLTIVGDQNTSVGRPQKGKIWRIVRRVMEMGCPYLENLEESVVKEILFSEGEARFRTLQWLVGRFYPRLQELLFVPGTSTTTIDKLTLLLADLGLCSPTDYELVKGVSGVSRQVRFLDALLDLIAVGGWDSTDFQPPCDRLQSQTNSSCAFIDQLCCSEDLDSVLPTSLSLIPPGIAKATILEVTSDGMGQSSLRVGQRGSPPSSAELTKQLEKLALELKYSQERLEKLSQEHSYEDLDPIAVGNAEKSLLVNLETLSQLSVNYSDMYESEIQPWTDQSMPELNNLGPSFKRLISSVDLLQACTHTLKSLDTAAVCHDTLLVQAKDVIQKCLETLSNSSWGGERE